MAASIDFIYTHLNNLRKKIKQAGGTDHIRTIYGTGYKLSEE
jgi:DNA-binding response OmpR family regulator